jgi:hypothetical protein
MTLVCKAAEKEPRNPGLSGKVSRLFYLYDTRAGI